MADCLTAGGASDGRVDGAGRTDGRRLAADVDVWRLRRRQDFLAANAGCRVPMPYFILLVKANDLAVTRIGFTTSRKVGGAVQRNRARRRLREAARLVMPAHGLGGMDHVFIARRLAKEPPFADLVQLMQKALVKARRRMGQAT